MKRKITYTKKMHAYRLSLMLDKPGPCNLCPAHPIDQWKNWSHITTLMQSDDVCNICRNFIGIPKFNLHRHRNLCPCYVRGEKAISDSYKALTKYYNEEKS